MYLSLTMILYIFVLFFFYESVLERFLFKKFNIKYN